MEYFVQDKDQVRGSGGKLTLQFYGDHLLPPLSDQSKERTRDLGDR